MVGIHHMGVSHHFVFKMVESHHMVDVHHMVEIHHMVESHHIFVAIALEMACRPVRVQTREYKDLVFHLTLLHLKVSFMMRLHHMKRLHPMMPFYHMTDFHHIIN